jgi:hypothetical protein
MTINRDSIVYLTTLEDSCKKEQEFLRIAIQKIREFEGLVTNLNILSKLWVENPLTTQDWRLFNCSIEELNNIACTISETRSYIDKSANKCLDSLRVLHDVFHFDSLVHDWAITKIRGAETVDNFLAITSSINCVLSLLPKFGQNCASIRYRRYLAVAILTVLNVKAKEVKKIIELAESMLLEWQNIAKDFKIPSTIN